MSADDSHEVRDRPVSPPKDRPMTWPRQLAESAVTGVGNRDYVEKTILLVIERCAQEAESRLKRRQDADGRQCQCERCDETMTVASLIRSLARVVPAEPTPRGTTR